MLLNAKKIPDSKDLEERKIISDMRLECLKLAYEVALKTEELGKHKKPEDRFESLQDIMWLAHANFSFLNEGKVDWEDRCPEKSDASSV